MKELKTLTIAEMREEEVIRVHVHLFRRRIESERERERERSESNQRISNIESNRRELTT